MLESLLLLSAEMSLHITSALPDDSTLFKPRTHIHPLPCFFTSLMFFVFIRYNPSPFKAPCPPGGDI
jgi:hypothetical protein